MSRVLLFCGVLALALVAGAGVSATPTLAAGNGQVEHLPLSLFVDAQGLQDVWFPPEPALFAWTGRPPTYHRMGWIDYVGAADRWLVDNGYDSLGTEVSGTLTRRIVGDNLAEYKVDVRATNALAWCVRGFDANGDPDFSTLLLGAHVDAVAAGATPALGDSHFAMTWRQNADLPIADVNLAANYGPPYTPDGWEFTLSDMRGTANGPLHAAAGLGPEGTPGKMVISQSSSNTHALGHGNGNLDGFPAEVMDLRAVGN